MASPNDFITTQPDASETTAPNAVGMGTSEAMFKTQTAPGSFFLPRIVQDGFEPDPNYKLNIDEIPQNYWEDIDVVAQAVNKEHELSILGELSKRYDIRRRASEGGFFEGMLVQAGDPLNWIAPVAVLNRIKTAGTVSTEALRGMTIGAAQTAAQNLVIGANDTTLTTNEALLDITMGTLFGAGLGALGGLWAKERAKTENISEAEARQRNEKQLFTSIFGDVSEQLKDRLDVGAELHPSELIFGADTAGAARVKGLEPTTNVQEGLYKKGNLGKVISLIQATGQSPQMRLLASKSTLGRLASQLLGETAGLIDRVVTKGGTSHIAAETRIKQFMEGTVGRAERDLGNLYNAYRHDKDRGTDKLMSFTEFKDAVTSVMDSQGASGNKFLDDAAAMYNEKLFGKVREEGKEVGIFDQGMSDKPEDGGQFYVPIIVDREKFNRPDVQLATKENVIKNAKALQEESLQRMKGFQSEKTLIKASISENRSILRQVINSIKESSSGLKEAFEKEAISRIPKDIKLSDKITPDEVKAGVASKAEYLKSLQARIAEGIDEGVYQLSTKEDKLLDDAAMGDVELRAEYKADLDDSKDVFAQAANTVVQNVGKYVDAAKKDAEIAFNKSLINQIEGKGKALSQTDYDKAVRQALKDANKEYRKALDNIISDATKDVQIKIKEDLAAMKERRSQHGFDEKIANLSKEDIDAEAENFIQRILGTPYGPMPYDIDMFSFFRGKSSGNVPYAKHRTKTLTHEQWQAIKVTDITQIAHEYGRTMSAEIALRKSGIASDEDSKFWKELQDYSTQEAKELSLHISDSDPTGAKFIYNMYKEWNELIAAKRVEVDKLEGNAKKKGEKEIVAMNKELRRDMTDVSAMIDILRGKYKIPDDPLSRSTRIGKVLTDLAYVTKLGGQTISSFADPGRIVIHHGLNNTIGTLVKPLITNLKGLKIAIKEAREIVGIMEHVTNTRIKQSADLYQDHLRLSKFEKVLGFASDKMGVVTGMSYWNSAMKQLDGLVGMQRLLKTAVRGGNEKDKLYLRHLGISDRMAARIKAEIDFRGGDQGDFVFADVDRWLDKEAAEMLRLAMRKEIDTAIITAGLDRPNMSRHGIGKIGFQFTSFGYSTVERGMIPALQQKDMAVFNGIVLQVALGMMIYKLKSDIKGQETSDEPSVWIREGISRSGVIGIFDNYDLMAHTFTGGNFSLASAMGAKDPSRLASRGTAGMILGPSASTATDAAIALRGIFTGFEDAEVNATRKLIIYQNVLGVQQIFNKIQEYISK